MVVAGFNAGGLQRRTEPGSGDYLWVVDVDEEQADGVSAIAGDIVHNLRSALDHLVWEFSDPDQRPRSEFPVYLQSGNGSDGFEGGGQPKIRTLPLALQSQVEELQPYHSGGSAKSHPLWLIHDLDRIDKHRRILAAPVAVNRINFVGPPMSVRGRGATSLALHGLTFTSGKRGNGDEVVRIAGSNPARSVAQFRPDVRFELSLDEPGLPELFVGQQLRQLRNFVKDEVLPRFDPFFAHV